MSKNNPLDHLNELQIEELFKGGVLSEREASEAKQFLLKKAELKKADQLNKKAALLPQKYYYDVKVECMLPATLTYRVYAENAEQASLMIKGIVPNMVKHRLIGKKDIKLAVYDAGSNMIKFMKNLLGV